MIEIGQKPEGLPMPCSNNIVGRLYIKLRKYNYIVDVFHHWSDGELVWQCLQWSNSAWRKISTRTRTDERHFPKSLAKKASNFLQFCEIVIFFNFA